MNISTVVQDSFIYLACPYSHPDPAVREARFHAVNQAAAHLIKQGMTVFSPISHSHHIHLFDLPQGWEFWQTFDFAFLDRSSDLVVLTLDGWKESIGVNAEIEYARKLGLPIHYLNPSEAGINACLTKPLQQRVGEWADAKFPTSSPASIMAHLCEEEIHEFAATHDPVEAVDCCLLLLHHAHKCGYDLMAEVEKKFAIVQQRQYASKPNEHGYFKHVEAAP